MKLTHTFAIPALLGALTFGCASNDRNEDGPGINAVSDNDADQLNSQRSRFDSAEDPPFNVQTRFAAGQLAESQQQPEAAIAQYNEALKLDPKHKQSLYRMGVLQAQTKQHEQAIETFKRYVEVTGGSAVAYADLGYCYELAGKPDQAEAAYQRGIAKDPKCQPCRVNYGLLLARTHRAVDAVEQMRVVLTTAEVHYNLGSVYQLQGRKDDAKYQYLKALEFDPAMRAANMRLAELK